MIGGQHVRNIGSKGTDFKKSELTERLFFQSIISSILGIFLCSVVLCSVTWAWFTVSTTSSSNSIRAANCNVSVEIKSCDNSSSLVVSNTESLQDIEHSFDEGTYEIKMKATGTASSGYCIIYINDYPDHPFYTQQIATNENEGISFRLELTEATVISIVTCWGISTQTDRTFEDGKVYSVNVSDTSINITSHLQN
jgi:hypothetical protein